MKTTKDRSERYERERRDASERHRRKLEQMAERQKQEQHEELASDFGTNRSMNAYRDRNGKRD